jgi:CCR4-NOT transcription complex subunit 1
LDKWLADNVNAHGAEFLHSVIVFLDQKMESEKASKNPAVEHRTMPLNPQTITIFLRTLRNQYVIFIFSSVLLDLSQLFLLMQCQRNE